MKGKKLTIYAATIRNWEFKIMNKVQKDENKGSKLMLQIKHKKCIDEEQKELRKMKEEA